MNNKSTREKVLQTLLSRPRTTTNEIAESVGINNISVRHHLTSLQAEGLISYEEERHGVGRPRLVYFLTDTGLEKFPTNYMRLATRLLTQLKSSLPAATVDNIFTQIAMEMSTNYREQAKNLSLEGKLNLITKLLGEEGFTVEWEKENGDYLIKESSCPYLHVGQDHPEVCSVDQTMISSILSIPVEKISCVLGGSNQCTYIVKNKETVESNI
jgi:DeoR family transcriptional regulator, suf operon transcriptional repressor